MRVKILKKLVAAFCALTIATTTVVPAGAICYSNEINNGVAQQVTNKLCEIDEKLKALLNLEEVKNYNNGSIEKLIIEISKSLKQINKSTVFSIDLLKNLEEYLKQDLILCKLKNSKDNNLKILESFLNYFRLEIEEFKTKINNDQSKHVPNVIKNNIEEKSKDGKKNNNIINNNKKNKKKKKKKKKSDSLIDNGKLINNIVDKNTKKENEDGKQDNNIINNIEENNDIKKSNEDGKSTSIIVDSSSKKENEDGKQDNNIINNIEENNDIKKSNEDGKSTSIIVDNSSKKENEAYFINIEVILNNLMANLIITNSVNPKVIARMWDYKKTQVEEKLMKFKEKLQDELKQKLLESISKKSTNLKNIKNNIKSNIKSISEYNIDEIEENCCLNINKINGILNEQKEKIKKYIHEKFAILKEELSEEDNNIAPEKMLQIFKSALNDNKNFKYFDNDFLTNFLDDSYNNRMNDDVINILNDIGFRMKDLVYENETFNTAVGMLLDIVKSKLCKNAEKSVYMEKMNKNIIGERQAYIFRKFYNLENLEQIIDSFAETLNEVYLIGLKEDIFAVENKQELNIVKKDEKLMEMFGRLKNIVVSDKIIKIKLNSIIDSIENILRNVNENVETQIDEIYSCVKYISDTLKYKCKYNSKFVYDNLSLNERIDDAVDLVKNMKQNNGNNYVEFGQLGELIEFLGCINSNNDINSYEKATRLINCLGELVNCYLNDNNYFNLNLNRRIALMKKDFDIFLKRNKIELPLDCKMYEKNNSKYVFDFLNSIYNRLANEDNCAIELKNYVMFEVSRFFNLNKDDIGMIKRFSLLLDQSLDIVGVIGNDFNLFSLRDMYQTYVNMLYYLTSADENLKYLGDENCKNIKRLLPNNINVNKLPDYISNIEKPKQNAVELLKIMEKLTQFIRNDLSDIAKKLPSKEKIKEKIDHGFLKKYVENNRADTLVGSLGNVINLLNYITYASKYEKPVETVNWKKQNQESLKKEFLKNDMLKTGKVVRLNLSNAFKDNEIKEIASLMLELIYIFANKGANSEDLIKQYIAATKDL